MQSLPIMLFSYFCITWSPFVPMSLKSKLNHLKRHLMNFSHYFLSGKKLPIVIFNCTALAQPQTLAAGQKYHLTFKTVNADAKLISQICHAHGLHEVHSSNTVSSL